MFPQTFHSRSPSLLCPAAYHLAHCLLAEALARRPRLHTFHLKEEEKEDYENKAAEILDNPPFVKLDKDPTYKNEQRVNDTLKRLAKKEKSDQAQKKER